jgi:protein-L-isoaspartate(D-aspartate) O-methyltransferase
LLAHIGCTVTALEVEPQLAAIARGLGLTLVEGPLADGHAAAAPYDIILIDGAVEFIPDALVEQLADGGRLGTALVERGISRMIVGRKAGGGFGYLSIGDAGVPALPGFALPRAFTF